MSVIVSLLIIIYLGLMPQENYKKLRDRMVNEQILARGINDRKVTDAFRKVPRHEFVLTEHKRFAYSDSPLPIE